MNKCNLPVLKSYMEWELKGDFGYGMEYYIPDEITNEGGYWIGCKSLRRHLSYYNWTTQMYYDRWFKNWTVPSQRPRCANCGKPLAFHKISKGGYGHMIGQVRMFCNYECRDEYSHKHRLNGFELMNDNPDKYPDLQKWYKSGGGLGYLQNHLKDYGLDSLGSDTSRGLNGWFHSNKFNKDFYYRSSFEKLILEWAELEDSVIRLEVEPLKIPYWNSEFERYKIYKPDFLIEYNDGSIYIGETKPSSQCNWQENIDKWKAAEIYCKERGWKFEVWTEHDI